MFPIFPNLTITRCDTHMNGVHGGFLPGTTTVIGVTADGTTITLRGTFGGSGGWTIDVRCPGDNFLMRCSGRGVRASRVPDPIHPFRGNPRPSHRDGGAWVDDGAGCVVFDPTA